MYGAPPRSSEVLARVRYPQRAASSAYPGHEIPRCDLDRVALAGVLASAPRRWLLTRMVALAEVEAPGVGDLSRPAPWDAASRDETPIPERIHSGGQVRLPRRDSRTRADSAQHVRLAVVQLPAAAHCVGTRAPLWAPRDRAGECSVRRTRSFGFMTRACLPQPSPGYMAAGSEVGDDDPVAMLRAGFLAWVRLAGEPVVRRVRLIDAPAVIGWRRWREIEEGYGLGLIRAVVHAAAEQGRVPPELVDPFSHVLLATVNELALL